MPFADSLTKAGRLMELQMIFATGPQRSHSSTELAGRLGIAPRTVRNYLNELSGSGRLPLILDKKRWRVAPDARLEMPPVRFMLEEAAAVYLAARLLCRHSDESNPAVASSVGKLAAVVPSDLGAVMQDLASRVGSGEAGPFGEVFRAFAYGWALHREIVVTYLAFGRKTSRTCRFRTHLLEPSVHGFSLYAVGHADPPGELRVFKLERVVKAELTATPFEPVPTAELLARLERSWDVWLSDADAVEVRLRFAPEAARSGAGGALAREPAPRGPARRRRRDAPRRRLDDRARPVDPRLGRRLRGPRPARAARRGGPPAPPRRLPLPRVTPAHRRGGACPRPSPSLHARRAAARAAPTKTGRPARSPNAMTRVAAARGRPASYPPRLHVRPRPATAGRYERRDLHAVARPPPAAHRRGGACPRPSPSLHARRRAAARAAPYERHIPTARRDGARPVPHRLRPCQRAHVSLGRSEATRSGLARERLA